MRRKLPQTERSKFYAREPYRRQQPLLARRFSGLRDRRHRAGWRGDACCVGLLTLAGLREAAHGYQMVTRRCGGVNILSPGLTPKAS
jgi:hypothetical protein